MLVVVLQATGSRISRVRNYSYREKPAIKKRLVYFFMESQNFKVVLTSDSIKFTALLKVRREVRPRPKARTFSSEARSDGSIFLPLLVFAMSAYLGAKRLSTKRKFIADGVFYSELNELLTRELAEDGYAGVEVRTTPHRTE